MNDPSQIFLFLASLTLFLQFIKDIEFMKVDSTKNFFMMGVGISLAIISQNSWMYLILALIVFVFNFVIHKIEVKRNKDFFGDGDKEVFAWLVPGLIVVGLNSVLIFLISFSALLLMFGVAQKHYKFIETFVPGMVFICLAFVLSIAFI